MNNLYIKILILIYVFSFTIYSIPPPRVLTEESINKYNQLRKIMAPKSNTIKTLNMNYSPALNKAPVPRFSWTGAVKLIVIPMQFQDVKFTEINSETTKQNIRQSLFGSDENTLATFYNKSSYGKMTVEELIVTDVVTSNYNMSYYGSPWDDSAGGTLPVEALDLAYSIDSNFKYIADNPQNIGNKDNYIHGVEALNMGKTHNDIDRVFLMIIHAGGAEESTGLNSDIWSHQWTINGNNSGHKVGNSTFYSYSTFAEFNTKDGSPVSIACHEFGHQLGASDFYGKTSNDGTGKWSLMDSGVWNGYYAGQPITNWWGSDFDGYHKELFGWLDAVEMNTLSEGTNEITVKSISNLSNLNDSNKIYKFYVNLDKTEYFIFYVKEKIDYDRFLALNETGDSGLTILHIDENIKYTDDKIYLDNTSFREENYPNNHMAAWLVRADNYVSTTSKRTNLFPYDPFFENKTQDFTPSSLPSSYGYYSLNAPIIKDISRNISNSDISFKFINKNTWTVNIVSNPFDNKFIHFYARPNYNPDYDSVEIVLNYKSKNYKIPLKSQKTTFSVPKADISTSITKYILWSGEQRLSDLPEGSFNIIVNEYNSFGTIINTVNSTNDFSSNNIPFYTIGKNIENIGFSLNSSSNMLYTEEIVQKTSELEPLYVVKGFSEEIPQITYKNSDFVFLVYQDGVWQKEQIKTKSFKAGLFKDLEKPQISIINPREFKVYDKYSGVKDVTAYGISGENYNILENNKNYFISKTPEEDIIIEATDFSLNKSATILKKAPSSFTSIDIYPVPADLFLNIKYNITSISNVNIDILDVNGKKIQSIKDSTGNGFYSWDLTDKRGNKIANGVYFIRLFNGNEEIIKKVVILK